MSVDLKTPTKLPPMSMWEGISAEAIIDGARIPGDIVVMTVDSRLKFDVGGREKVPVWGQLGRVLHHSKGQNKLNNYTIAVMATCSSDLSTYTKLPRVARSAFKIVARGELIIPTGTIGPGGSGDGFC